MNIFILLAFIFLIFSISRKSAFLLFSFAILFVISAYREYTVGTDTLNYLLHFEQVFVSPNSRFEAAWNWLNSTIFGMGGTFTDLLIISTLLCLIPVFWVSFKDSKNANFSLFLYFSLYFYSYSLNILRQMIAVSFVLLAFYMIKQHKKLFALGIILFASQFHLSALIALPMLFLDKFKLSDQAYFVLLFFAFVVGLFMIQQLISFAQIIPYAHYLRTGELGNMSGNLVYLMIFNMFFLFLYMVVKEKSFYFHLFFVFVILENLFVRIPFSERIVLFNSIAQILFFPEVVTNNKLQQRWVVWLVVVLYSFFIFFRQLGNGGIFPYENVLF